MAHDRSCVGLIQESLGMEVIGDEDLGLGVTASGFAIHGVSLVAWGHDRQPADLLVFSSGASSLSIPMVVTSDGQAAPVDIAGLTAGKHRYLQNMEAPLPCPVSQSIYLSLGAAADKPTLGVHVIPGGPLVQVTPSDIVVLSSDTQLLLSTHSPQSLLLSQTLKPFQEVSAQLPTHAECCQEEVENSYSPTNPCLYLFLPRMSINPVL